MTDNTHTQIYVFDQAQLQGLLKGAIEMFQEYRDHHDRSEEAAKPAAVDEMIEGLEAERWLSQDDPLFHVTSQIIPIPLEVEP